MIRRRAETLVIAALGVVVFQLLSLPLPFLFGPLFACLLAAFARRPLADFGQISVGARTILGVAIGAMLTPDVVAQVPRLFLSVALVPVYIVVIGAIGVPFFQKFCGFDRVTAWYAAMPGGLQDMILFGQEAGGNVRALTLVHVTRVLVIVTLAPLILVWAFDADLSGPLGAPASSLPVSELVLMAFAALVGWKVGERVGLFGASILGPMIVTACLSLGGAVHSRPPAEAIMLAQYVIGIGIGVGYVGVTLRELRRDVLAGAVFVVILAALAVAFTEIVILLGALEPLEGFMSFAPGGQAEMVVLAIIVGADPGLVVVHHLTRVFLVITCAPLAARIFLPRIPRD